MIYLIGMPGVGKSTFGAKLSRKLKKNFCDLDIEIVSRCNMPIDKIFLEYGEDFFRAKEREVFFDLKLFDGVLSLGGGSIISPEICNFLLTKTVIHLFLPDGINLSRIMQGNRPLFQQDNPKKIYSKLLAERLPIFERLATITFDPRQPVTKAIEMLEYHDLA